MELFIDRLEKILKEKKISQTELAEKVKIRRPTISEWKKNGSIPAADVALRIAQYLDVSIEWLVTGEQKAPETSEYSADEQAMIAMYRKNSTEQKSAINSLLTANVNQTIV